MTAIFDSPLLAVLALILGFGFLIFVHEMGHFLVAKAVGIRCTQFAIGFGNAIFAWRRGLGLRVGGTEKQYIARAVKALEAEGQSLKSLSEHARNQKIMEKADALGMGETEYRLNSIPLGGYVKMLGQEDMDPNAQSDDPRAFNRKPVWARAAVISAGVIMNLIFGLIFFIICFQIGVEFPAPTVGSVAPGSPAAQTYAEGHEGEAAYQGLEPGDRITHVQGEAITDMAGVRIATALSKGGEAVGMTVQRRGAAQPLTFKIIAEASAASNGLLSAGISPSQSLKVASVIPGRGDALAAINPGMRLQSVNGQAIHSQGGFARRIADSSSDEATLAFIHPDSGESVNVTLGLGVDWQVEDGRLHLLGMVPGIELYPSDEQSPAVQAGVRAGDVLRRVGDLEWPTRREQVVAQIQGADGRPIALEVLRDGEAVSLGKVAPRDGRLGVLLSPPGGGLAIFDILPGSPLAQSARDPILPGSRLVSVAGESVRGWSDAQRLLKQAAAEALASEAPQLTVDLGIAVNLEGNPVETLSVTLDEAALANLAALNWQPPQGVFYEMLRTTVKADNPWEATLIGARKTGEFIQQTYITLLRLIQGTIKPTHLRGPVGIVDEGAKIAEQGFAYYLFFLGLISVNLAVINFLPIPIVDGGLMVFLLIEKVKGSPASPKVQTAAMLVGLVLIACVFLFVTYNDIARIVTG